MLKVPDLCSLKEFLDKTSFEVRNAQNNLSLDVHRPSVLLVLTEEFYQLVSLWRMLRNKMHKKRNSNRNFQSSPMRISLLLRLLGFILALLQNTICHSTIMNVDVCLSGSQWALPLYSLLYIKSKFRGRFFDKPSVVYSLSSTQQLVCVRWFNYVHCH